MLFGSNQHLLFFGKALLSFDRVQPDRWLILQIWIKNSSVCMKTRYHSWCLFLCWTQQRRISSALNPVVPGISPVISFTLRRALYMCRHTLLSIEVSDMRLYQMWLLPMSLSLCFLISSANSKFPEIMATCNKSKETLALIHIVCTQWFHKVRVSFIQSQIL